MAQQRYSQEHVIEALRNSHGLKAPAARALGCHRNTVQEYCDRYPKIADVIQEERETMKDTGESALFKKVQEGEPWAVCFFLKTQAKDRGYIEKSETDITSGGQPISFTLQIGTADANSDSE